MSGSGRRGGVPPMLLMAVGVSVLLLAMLGMGRLTQLSQLLQQSQEEFGRANRENQELARQVVELRNGQQALEEQARGLGSQVSEAKHELSSAQEDAQALRQQHAQLTNEHAALQAQAEELRRVTEAARQRANELEQETTELTRSLNRLKARAKLLDRDHQKLTQKVATLERSNPAALPSTPIWSDTLRTDGPTAVELPPIIVQRPGVGPSGARKAQIVEVDTPNQFFIINQGTDDGIRMGMRLDVLRGAELVGRGQVMRLRPSMAACDVIAADTPGPLRVGDAVAPFSP